MKRILVFASAILLAVSAWADQVQTCTQSASETKVHCKSVYKSLRKTCDFEKEEIKRLIRLKDTIDNLSAEAEACLKSLEAPLQVCWTKIESARTVCGAVGAQVSRQQVDLDKQKSLAARQKETVRIEESEFYVKEAALKAEETKLIRRQEEAQATPAAEFTLMPAIASERAQLSLQLDNLAQEKRELNQKLNSANDREVFLTIKAQEVSQQSEQVVAATKALNEASKEHSEGKRLEASVKQVRDNLRQTNCQLGDCSTDPKPKPTKASGETTIEKPDITNPRPDTAGPSDKPSVANRPQPSAEESIQPESKPKVNDGEESGPNLPNLFQAAAQAFAPSAPAPAQDCSNPSFAATSVVCACQQNPADSRCGAILAQADQAGFVPSARKGKSDPSTKAVTYSGLGSDPSVLEKSEEKKREISKHGKLETKAGGVGSVGITGAGKNLSGTAKTTGAPAAHGSAAVHGGFYSGSQSSGQKAQAQAQGSARQALNRKFAFNQDPRIQQMNMRSVAQAQLNQGMAQRQPAKSAPSGLLGKDGVTGPHTDLFRKVRIRYNRFGDILRP